VVKRIIKLVGSIIFFSIKKIKKSWKNTVQDGDTHRCVVLYYHGIRREEQMRFARQMDDLLRFRVPIALNEKFKPEAGIHYVAVTFDDGFISTFRNAVPEMERRKIPSTVFISAGCLGRSLPWSEIDGKMPDRIINYDELKSFKSDLVTIGSHGVTHASILSLDDIHARKEIAESRYLLENITGKAVRLLSFPAGDYSSREVMYARQEGYESIFTIEPRLAFEKGHEFIIGRFHADPTDWRLEFILKIHGYYSWLCWAYRLKGKIRSAFNRNTLYEWKN
jgi:peptidoglycan/xylan/chitin deacetylase (PgdA/CDA1 family)